MSMNSKTDITNAIVANITSDNDNDEHLNPINGFPIKYTNLSSFLSKFIEYLFPTTSADLYGKSPIYRKSDYITNPNNTNYSDLKYEAIVPIGGIIMYGGDNTTLDGYLFCDGSFYDTTLNVNAKYKALKAVIGQKFFNPLIQAHLDSRVNGLPNPNIVYLPDFRSKSAVGYDSRGTTTRVETGLGNNTQGVGNIGGFNTTLLAWSNIPTHKHEIIKTTSSAGTSTTPTNGVAWSMSSTTNNSGAHQHFFANATYLQSNSVYNGNSTLFGYSQTYSGITFANNSWGTQNSDLDNMPIAFYDKTIPGGGLIGISPGNSQFNDGGMHTHNVVVNDYQIKGFTEPIGSATPTPINNRSEYLVVNYIIRY